MSAGHDNSKMDRGHLSMICSYHRACPLLPCTGTPDTASSPTMLPVCPLPSGTCCLLPPPSSGALLAMGHGTEAALALPMLAVVACAEALRWAGGPVGLCLFNFLFIQQQGSAPLPASPVNTAAPTQPSPPGAVTLLLPWNRQPFILWHF